jgi:bidirectional [NiFe] hydrogenase diaphorase subunit
VTGSDRGDSANSVDAGLEDQPIDERLDAGVEEDQPVDERLARLGERRRVARSVAAAPAGPIRASANVCVAAGCLSLDSDRLLDAIASGAAGRGMTDVAVKRVGCLGLCANGPLVDVPQVGRLFERVDPGSAESIELVLEGLSGAQVGRLTADDPFFSRQMKIVLENSGRIDPEDIDDYVAHGGYEALTQAVTTMRPDQVIEEVTRSGLRGRGGAGYPTGLKWQTVAKAAEGEGKFVICNADEGDPGAFMDRSVLEGDPQRVLEGMAIGGYAVGARQGYVYARAEYPLAVKRLSMAIRQAERRGLLGAGIAGTTFDFHIEVRIGAGAFVCGEETALIASVEGGRGTPRPRPPFPAESGLWGRPTLINNVETFASVAPIVVRGGAWYRTIGAEGSAGTKVFALAGRVVNSGLIEVPLGISLREIVFDIGGGIVNGGRFKAVQTGGPSGGCIPEELLDMPVEYASLSKAGSIMGSGGMIVMDDTSCMVDVAKYFMDFCREESCGKCVPCRVGTVQLHGLLAKITSGRATVDDLAMLERLSHVVRTTSLCGLGQGAPNPVFSTLRYFRDEYLAHVERRMCPAGVCTMHDTEGQ